MSAPAKPPPKAPQSAPILEAVQKSIDALKSLEKAEQKRVIAAVRVLLGIDDEREEWEK